MNYFFEVVKYDKNIPGKILMQDKPGWRCNTTLHWHSEPEFVYMIEGSINVTMNGKEHLIQSGEFFFCNSGIIHSTSVPDNLSNYKYIVVQLSHDLLLRYHDKCLFEIGRGDAYNKLKACLKHLVYLSELDCTRTDFKIMEIEKCKDLLDICQILLSDCIVNDANNMSGSYNFTGHAKKIMEYVFENYTEKLSLETIADAVGLSPQYLSKYFKSATNMGLLRYINLIRLEHANEYLINSNANITEAALNNGFSDVKTYVRTCKKVYGMTPSAFRKAILSS